MSPLIASLILSTSAPVELPPATALALDVAEAVGATVQTLAIDADASVSTREREAAAAALLETRLFRLVDDGSAAVVLRLTRITPSILLATVERRDGERMWVGRVTWPAEREVIATLPPEIAPQPNGDRLDDSERTYQKVLRYRRESLRLAPVRRTWGPTPFFVSGYRHRGFYSPAFGFAMGHGGAVAPVTDWVILRGTAEVVDDLELAQLLGDEALERHIEEERFWPRLWWVAGFGAAAAAGVGTGVWLLGSDERDTRTVGISLITLGAVSAVLAMLFPSIGAGHVLEPGDAERRCDDYNARLRREIGLRPEDLERFPQPEAAAP